MKCICKIIIGCIVFSLYGCGGCSGSSPKRKELKLEPAHNYDPEPYIPPLSTPNPKSSGEDVQEQKGEEPVRTNILQETYKLSAAYEEGYDDGEDDAVNHTGFGYQQDDSNHYKGKKKRDYEEGYADGYEAGYDDNMSDNDD